MDNPEALLEKAVREAQDKDLAHLRNAIVDDVLTQIEPEQSDEDRALCAERKERAERIYINAIDRAIRVARLVGEAKALTWVMDNLAADNDWTAPGPICHEVETERDRLLREMDALDKEGK